MANELGKAKAAICKALLDEGRNSQDISILFGVNSRAISHVKSGEEYSAIEPDYSHGVPSEIFELSLYEIFRTLGADNIRKIHKLVRRRTLESFNVTDMAAILTERLEKSE